VTLPLVFLFWGQSPLVGVAAAIALTAIPIAACVAILRFHLYDVDVVINRAVVYGTLTLLLAAAYGATTIMLGTTLGRGSAWATAGATLVVAAAFAPLRSRIQKTVDARFNRARHNAGLRMAGFLESVRAGHADPEEVETVLRDVVSDPTLSVAFFLPASEQYVDSGGAPAPERELSGRETVLLQREGRPLARVTLAAAGHDRREVVRAAAEAGALAIEIAALQVELRRQLAEVQASRARIVQVGYLERRRLERNLHDGAQQRLVSVGLALRHVQHQLRSGSTDLALSSVDAAVGEVSSTIQELRELAHGLPPAALDGGLEPAFRELAARTSVPVEVRALTERLDQGLTTAAYFIGCKAHQRRQARRRQPDRAQRRAPQRALGGVRGR
jgi:signal transduction histidine kinase